MAKTPDSVPHRLDCGHSIGSVRGLHCPECGRTFNQNLPRPFKDKWRSAMRGPRLLLFSLLIAWLAAFLGPLSYVILLLPLIHLFLFRWKTALLFALLSP